MNFEFCGSVTATDEAEGMFNYIRPLNCDYEAADNFVWISKPNFEFCSSATGTDEAEGMVNYIRPFNCDYEAAANFVWISNFSAL